jgi:uncharacterized protein DUF4145
MNSWWELGEGAGLLGETLAVYEIECPFCCERGKFNTEFHAEKKKPNSRKQLNFDTLRCVNCGGYVQVLWSASEFSGSQGLHQFRVQPFPLKIPDPPEYWPREVGRSWQQAHRSLQHESWDAAAVMARSALQAVLRGQGAKGRDLKAEIANLADRGILPPLMREWSDEVRELGNDATHPDANSQGTNPTDARDVVKFLDYLIQYLYDLPKAIADYRDRRHSSSD